MEAGAFVGVRELRAMGLGANLLHLRGADYHPFAVTPHPLRWHHTARDVDGMGPMDLNSATSSAGRGSYRTGGARVPSLRRLAELSLAGQLSPENLMMWLFVHECIGADVLRAEAERMFVQQYLELHSAGAFDPEHTGPGFCGAPVMLRRILACCLEVQDVPRV